jgi:AAT family amino acid transporter/GABA permease
MWFFPWLSYAAIAGMAAVLIAMALTPPDLSRQLFWGVVSLAVAVLAFLLVDARRKARSAGRVGPVAPNTDSRS